MCRSRTLFLPLLLLFTLAGHAASRAAGPATIGVSMHFLRDDYAGALVRAIRARAASRPGTRVVIADANGAAAKQLTDIENLVVQKVDALIVVPIDEKAILSGLRKANAARIPVIAVTQIPQAQVAATVAARGDYANGKASGDLLRQRLKGKGGIAIIDMPYSLWRIDERERGLKDALAGSAIQIVAHQAGTDQAAVQDVVAGLLIAHPDLAGIWCSFSNQLVGAADALRQARRSDVALTGIDADRAVIERIRKGWITGAAAQFPTVHGTLAAEAALRILAGQPPPADVEAPVAVVTRDNADELQRRIWE
ncbi:MAG: sugar ABC transporter substrate-binding protein [Steroidobacteraceae bacterium]